MGLPTLRPPPVRNPENLWERDARAVIKRLTDIVGLQRATATVTLTTGVTRVSHGLGRAPVAWQLVDKNAQADVWRNGTANSDTIPLQASATVTVTIQFW